MWWPSFADKQVNNIQVVVMYSNMQRGQTILLKQDQGFTKGNVLFIQVPGCYWFPSPFQLR